MNHTDPITRRIVRTLAAACGILTLSQAGHAADLLNVSYDPTREFYQEFNAAFAKHWKAAFQKQHGSKYPAFQFAVDTAPQGKDIASILYHVRATPTTFVIDPQGKMISSLAGYNGLTPLLQKAVETALLQK